MHLTRGRLVTLLSVTSVLFVISILWITHRWTNEPVVAGRTISQWAAKISASSSDELRFDLMFYGEELLPGLIKTLQTQPATFDDSYREIYDKIPSVIRVYLPHPIDAELVRAQSANILGYMGEKAIPAIPALLGAIGDTNAAVRANSLGALSFIRLRLGETNWVDAEVVPLFNNAITDPDPTVRCNAINGVRLFGDLATNALPAVEVALHDPNERVRLVATNTFKVLQAPQHAKHDAQ